MTYLLLGTAMCGFFFLLVMALSISLRRVVPTNMVHIVQSGRKTRSFGSSRSNGNVYYRWPSALPIIGVAVTELPESVFVVGLNNYASYDAGRLPFMVDVRAFFRIQDSDVAANRVAHFPQLEEQLTAILQGAVRRVLAEHRLEEILGMRAELGKTFTDEVDAQLKEWGVAAVKTIEFMDMRDAPESTVIHDIMAKEQSRIQQESRVAIAGNQQTAQLREIDAQRTVEVQKQDAMQLVGQRTAEKDQAIGIANEHAKQEVLAEARTTAERQMEVQQVNNVRGAEIERSVAEVKATQAKNVAIVQAEATKQTTELVAAGNLAQAKNEAEATAAKGAAAAEAERLMQLAPVNAQVTLAQEIGENPGYQTYLVTLEQVRAAESVGTAMAHAIGNADLKIIANTGDVQSGIANLADVFSAKGGTSVAAMLAAIGQTPAGAALVERLTGPKTTDEK